MVREDHLSATETGTSAPRVPVFYCVIGALLLAAVGGAGHMVSRSSISGLPRVGLGSVEPAEPQSPTERFFRGWDQPARPDVALMLSGEMHGHLQPCGCSSPQMGGLARRYNFLQTMKRDRGWNVVAADLGDLAQSTGPQALIKYRYSMEALKKMGYSVVGIGENEINLPLFDALGEYSLNNPDPRVISTNLLEITKKYANMVGFHQVSQVGGIKIGFLSMASPEIAETGKGLEVSFSAMTKAAVQKAIAGLTPTPDLLVLLYQGRFKDAKEAKAFAAEYPEFQIIQYLGDKSDPEPSAVPIQSGQTLLISVGPKGRFVGVVGIYKVGNNPARFEFRYQLVQLFPDYETPVGKDAQNPIHELLQRYAQEIKDKNYLAKFTEFPSEHPLQTEFKQAAYAGSQACKKCHDLAYSIWEDSRHSHAFDSLVNKAVRPTLRQFDGECVACHTTGFTMRTGFKNEKETPKLLNVGCESCHGPSSLHVANPNDVPLRKAINPWKYQARNPNDLVLKIDRMCYKCHDLDNSHDYKFETYWNEKKIAHPNP